ncbi:MAG: type II toxin-antitoxin system RelE/ParE family toxin [Chromatiaceae bacterium]|jgi:mRNA interferase RelE/StbE|nr:type II toxin-antitoxin system RelE/ParE family toxin [Chromatiaceae bacterium]
MSYELHFHPEALDEWGRLDKPIREQIKKKLAERLIEPHVPASQLAGRPGRYKIKLRSAGIRLVYEVREAELVVLVIAVGKRERNAVYKVASRR